MGDLISWWSSQLLPLIEWWAVGLAIIYIVLAARNSSWCWPFALVSSVLWSYQVLVAYQLHFDAALNAFYAVMAIVGLWRWRAGAAESNEVAPSIERMSSREHGVVLIAGALLTVLGVVLAKAYTSAAMPLADALTTVYSVAGTILLVERRLESWLYLLAMDVIYVWLYIERGSTLFAGLFVVYCVLAVIGYLNWRRLADARSETLAVVSSQA